MILVGIILFSVLCSTLIYEISTENKLLFLKTNSKYFIVIILLVLVMKTENILKGQRV